MAPSRLDGVGEGGRQGRRTDGSESWGWAGRGTQGRVGTVSSPPDRSVHLPPVCRKFLTAHPAERGRLWEVEPPGAWGQRDNIWLKVQLQQSRLHLDCELGGAVPCGLITSRVGSDRVCGETFSLSLLQGLRREREPVGGILACCHLPS